MWTAADSEVEKEFAQTEVERLQRLLAEKDRTIEKLHEDAAVRYPNPTNINSPNSDDSAFAVGG